MNEISIWFPKDITKKIPRPICSARAQYDNMVELAYNVLPYGISTATYKDDYRRAANVEGNKFVAYDIDNGTSCASIISKISKYQHMILASMNHNKDKGDGCGVLERYHIFIELDVSITDNKFYKYIFNRFAKETFGLVFDKGVSDISRFFAPHREVLNVNSSGVLLSVNEYKAGFNVHDALQTKIVPMQKRALANKFSLKFNGMSTLDDIRRTDYFRRLESTFSAIGDRYYTMRRLVWFVKANGFGKEDAIQLVNECFPPVEGRNWTELTSKYYDWTQ